RVVGDDRAETVPDHHPGFGREVLVDLGDRVVVDGGVIEVAADLGEDAVDHGPGRQGAAAEPRDAVEGGGGPHGGGLDDALGVVGVSGQCREFAACFTGVFWVRGVRGAA